MILWTFTFKSSNDNSAFIYEICTWVCNVLCLVPMSLNGRQLSSDVSTLDHDILQFVYVQWWLTTLLSLCKFWIHWVGVNSFFLIHVYDNIRVGFTLFFSSVPYPAGRLLHCLYLLSYCRTTHCRHHLQRPKQLSHRFGWKNPTSRGNNKTFQLFSLQSAIQAPSLVHLFAATFHDIVSSMVTTVLA